MRFPSPHKPVGRFHGESPVCAKFLILVTRTPVGRDEDRINDTIPMPTFARRPSTMSSSFPVVFPQNSMAVRQRLQISELQFDKFSTPSSFSYWKIRFNAQVSSCSASIECPRNSKTQL